MMARLGILVAALAAIGMLVAADGQPAVLFILGSAGVLGVLFGGGLLGVRAMARHPAPALFLLTLLFLYLPILIIIVYSFNDSRSVNVWTEISLNPYVNLLQDEGLLAAAGNSLLLAIQSGALAAILGTMAAFVLVRGRRSLGRRLSQGLILGPVILPDVVIGFSLLMVFVQAGEIFGFPTERGAHTVVLAHATLGMAYVAIVVRARLSQMDPTLEEAAQDMGARPLTAFLTVTLPLLAPAVVAGFLLAFALSLDDLVLASFTTGAGFSTLPMEVFSQVRLGVRPEVNALASLLVMTVAVLAIGGTLATRHRRLLIPAGLSLALLIPVVALRLNGSSWVTAQDLAYLLTGLLLAWVAGLVIWGGVALVRLALRQGARYRRPGHAAMAQSAEA